MRDPAEDLCRQGAALAAQGMARAGSGNISLRLGTGEILISPTGVSLGAMEPAGLARLAPDGRHLGGPPPSKEWPLHVAIYRMRAGAGAVVHLHSPCATGWSMVEGLDPDDALPPLTPYAVMRLGPVALVPFAVPGDPVLGDWIAARCGRHSAFLLASHGPVVSAGTLADAVMAAEELEETARLALMLHGVPHRRLTAEERAAVEAAYGSRYR